MSKVSSLVDKLSSLNAMDKEKLAKKLKEEWLPKEEPPQSGAIITRLWVGWPVMENTNEQTQ